jgi:hypothetical protein
MGMVVDVGTVATEQVGWARFLCPPFFAYKKRLFLATNGGHKKRAHPTLSAITFFDQSAWLTL